MDAEGNYLYYLPVSEPGNADALSGEGTPTLLLMDWVDDEGEPVANACYSGRRHGYQTFQFNRNDPDGECTDIIAHEFTHCVTSTLMNYNLYYNDYGAINEAMSDICGNLVEDLLGDTEDDTWLIGEGGDEILRSMSDPHLCQQPAYVWDIYYLPPAERMTESNDNGGVHRNSSLLNMVAWRLKEAGIAPDDHMYFWMNAALAMTPRTDFAQLTELLPWCLDAAKLSEYQEPIKAAIEEVGIVAAALPAGDYHAVITCCGLADESYAKIIPTDTGWLMVTDEELAEYLGEEDFTPPLDVENGKVNEPETDTLIPALENVIELMPREEAVLTEDDPVE